MTSARIKSNLFIGSISDLWIWRTGERNLLLQWHEFLNGNHPYVVANFLGAEQFGNPRSNKVILDSLQGHCVNNITVLNLTLGDNDNTFQFRCDVQCARLIPGSQSEWLLMLDGDLARRGYDGGIAEASMACYYDTLRGWGFALMPKLAREQLYSQ